MSKASELIDIVRNGGRIKNEHTLFDAQLPHCPTGFCHIWRVVVCDDPDDIVECRKCGLQAVTKCDFDDEYA